MQNWDKRQQLQKNNIKNKNKKQLFLCWTENLALSYMDAFKDD